MKYTEAVYKRRRRGKIIYDGVLTYYDDEGIKRVVWSMLGFELPQPTPDAVLDRNTLP